ncbi:hypothetical protein WKW80_26925 [Variovorax humicola]|uniref:Uncharacterized protein n=1 Tax=Variovorax humicola TaxID=1769758 RepID=A0ABU8W7U8_9BURK
MTGHWEGETIVPDPTPAPGSLPAYKASRAQKPPRSQADIDAEARAYDEMMAYSAACVARSKDGLGLRGPAPPTGSDAYDYNDPLANRTPAASSVTSENPIGFPSVWICERENVLGTLRAQDGPFDTVSVPAGLNRPLTQGEVDALNDKFGVQP